MIKKNNIIIFGIIFIISFLLIFSFSTEIQGVYADGNLSITVLKDNNEYKYAISETNYSFSSLQDLIDDAKNRTSGILTINFNSVEASEKITIDSTVIINGSITFTFKDTQINEYAITVLNEGDLRISGASIYSNRGVLKINNNASLTIISGTFRIENNDIYNCSVIDISGNATINGGTIVFDKTTSSTLGSGISINELSNVTINNNTPISIIAPNAISCFGGITTIYGGTYSSTEEIIQGTQYGYSVDIWNASSVTINGGNFNNPIRLNGQNSKLYLNDGEFTYLSLMYFSNAFTGELKIKNIFISPPTFSYVDIDLSNFDTNKASFISTVASSATGYRATQIKFGNKTYSVNTQFDILEEREDIGIFDENNKYTLTVLDERGVYSTNQYSYGTEIECNSIEFTKLGYSILYWRENNILGNTITKFTIKSDLNIYIETELDSLEVNVSSIDLKYNGQNRLVTAEVFHPLLEDINTTISFSWKKLVSQNWVEISTSTSFNVLNVADSGQFRFTATINNNGNSKTTETESIVVNIYKGDYSEIAHEGLQGVYDDNKTLNDYVLDEYFWWKDTTIKPTVPITKYKALYNSDPLNYNNYELDVTLVLEKIQSPYPPNNLISNINGIYDKNKTLANFVINKVTWKDNSIVPEIGRHTYEATYNEDSDNYFDVNIYVDITITKATYDNKDIIIELKYSDEINTLYRVKNYIQSNYNGYTVNTGNDETIIGENVYNCTFNDDKTHYYDIDCIITIIVSKGKINYVPLHQQVDIYYGQKLNEITLNEYFWFANSETIPNVSGDFLAYYNNNPNYYENATTYIYVNIILLTYKAEEVPNLNINDYTYHKNITLSEINLPNEFTWVNEETLVVCNNTEYEAIYKGDNYHYPYETIVNINLKKAELKPPIFEDQEFTYNGEKHSIIVTNLDDGVTVTSYTGNEKIDAGLYEVNAKIKQEDEINYVLLPSEMSAKMLIKKAESIISCLERIDVLLEEEVNIEATVNNNEQSIIIPNIDTTKKGLQKIKLTTAESRNFLAGEKEIIISVNEVRKIVGDIEYNSNYDGSYYNGYILSASGVGEDIVINFNSTKNGVELNISGDVKDYTIGILMTDKLKNATNLKVYINGEEIEYTIEAESYIVFNAKNGDIVEFKTDKKFNWYWIPPVVIVVLAGIVILVIFIFKKKKKNIIENKEENIDLNNNKNSENALEENVDKDKDIGSIEENNENKEGEVDTKNDES